MTRDELIAALRREHSEWRIWASDEGRLYATRRGLQPDLPMQGTTVDSGTVTGLDAVIIQAEADAADQADAPGRPS
jgi:hypothetical protein